MSNPLLLAGRKFDVRAFMLVASVRPLMIYVYNETYVRAAMKSYTDPLTTRDRSRHVTNTHVQKIPRAGIYTLGLGGSYLEHRKVHQEAREAGVDPNFLNAEILPQMKRQLQFVASAVANDVKVRRAKLEAVRLRL